MKWIQCVAMIGVSWALATAARGQQVWKEPSVFDSHPTVSEFREEIFRADVVVRAKIVKILRRKEGSLADQDAIIEVLKYYKGKLDQAKPCVRMEIHQGPRRDKGMELAKVGDQVILPIKLVHTHAGAAPPNGQKVHLISLFYYSVGADGAVRSAFGVAPDLRPSMKLDRFEKLILDEVSRPAPKRPRFRLGEVLMTDNFDDGSLAGWTFLVGGRGFTEPPVSQKFDVLWIGPNSTLRNVLEFKGEPATTRVVRDPKTGLYKCRHNNTVVEFGVANGRLRMRSSHVWRHITVVAGHSEWTNYQIEVDVYNMIDIEQTHARANYLKFGPYGRVKVPHFPETSGEHSFVGVEIGNFANYDVSEETFGNSAYQIRCKYPEPKPAWRDHSKLLRLTKMLDYQAWPVPQKKKIKMTAKFFDNYVEGHFDDKKVLEGWIPKDHPGIKQGRIALWAFETWVEFDNLKVTKLVPDK